MPNFMSFLYSEVAENYDCIADEIYIFTECLLIRQKKNNLEITFIIFIIIISYYHHHHHHCYYYHYGLVCFICLVKDFSAEC